MFLSMMLVMTPPAVSIPREIVNFMNEQETIMNNMVKLCMEEFGRVSLNFVPSNKEKLI